MKAAIALLADYPVQNTARRMVLEIVRHARVEFVGSLLPAHVSLKQPFTFDNLDELEAWFDSFAERAQAFRVALDRIYYDEWEEYAMVGMGVHETPTLRALHNQINNELQEIVEDPSAPHDGDEYRFHLTIELGRVSNANPFKQFYESLPETRLDLSFVAEHMALFFYADGPIGPGSFICYKILPLGGTE